MPPTTPYMAISINTSSPPLPPFSTFRSSQRTTCQKHFIYKASGEIMPPPNPYMAISIDTSSSSAPLPPFSIFRSSENIMSALATFIQQPSVDQSPSGSSPFSTNQNSPTSYPNHQQENKCGKRYMTSRQLAKHKQTHRRVTDEKAHKCPHCDKVYDLKNSYSRHVRTHSQEIQCPDCEKSFGCRWTLRRHIRTHTGERPFTCSVCLKAFADKANLTAHIQTHSSNKPYICQRCGKGFILKRYLKNHDKSSCIRIHMQQQNFETDSTTVLDLAAGGAKRKTSLR